ncbi:MAG: hypothetical protein QOF94_2041 [Acidobacteriaceae bacterium]|jgi:hypothetical protein
MNTPPIERSLAEKAARKLLELPSSTYVNFTPGRVRT